MGERKPDFERDITVEIVDGRVILRAFHMKGEDLKDVTVSIAFNPEQAASLAMKIDRAASKAMQADASVGMTGDLSKFHQPARVQHQEIAPELANNLARSVEEG